MSEEWQLAAPTCRKAAAVIIRGKALALAALAAMTTTLAFAAEVLAQRPEVRISVAPTIVAEAASQTAVLINASPPEAIPANSFIRLRGLPASVSLSEGYSIGPGSWAIPLHSLPSLRAMIPAGVSGRSDLTISLVGVDGTLLAETRIAFVVGPSAIMAPGDGETKPTLLPPRPLPAGRPQLVPRTPELPPDEKERAEKLVAQGERFLTQGNVAIARQFFQRAADAGFAAAAVRLAATYDPGELARLQVQGVVPDRAEAKKWYERARELGAAEAEERLAKLGGS
jgi:hypothetical protein